MRKAKRIKQTEIVRYMSLYKLQKDIEIELNSIEGELLKLIPANGFRTVGMYQVCHKTGCRKSISWKNEVITRLGDEVANEITVNAPMGKITHKIKVEIRQDVKDIRSRYDVPDHIPDVQVGNYILTKKKIINT